MVGATAFMETLELAVELRRAGYGENGERLGFDLYPYTEDAVEAVRRSVLQWRFIDAVAGRIDDAALREAQPSEGRGARVRARLRGARSTMRLEQALAVVNAVVEDGSGRRSPSSSRTTTASSSPQRRWTAPRPTRG